MIEGDGSSIASIGMFCLVVLAGAGIVIIMATSVRIVPEYQRLVVFRLGRLIRATGPGLVFLIPLIDSAKKVDLREQEGHVTQLATTNDFVRVSIDYGWRYKVFDPPRSALETTGELNAALQKVVQEELRTTVGNLSLDQLHTERRQINEALRTRLDENGQRWGIHITQSEIREIARA